MRLIDADAFCEAIKEATDSIVKSGSSLTTKVIVISESELIKNLLCGEPTIDAEPVIRCKDCKHWFSNVAGYTGNEIGHCECANWMVGENGYCVYGEKGEKE